MSKNENKGETGEETEDEFKVILVGEIGTGKTSLINAAIGLQFQDQMVSTTTNSIMNKIMNIDGKSYTINLWDTIGQEKYRSLTKIFMKDANIIIFVYDITQLKSFQELNFWFEFSKDIISEDAVVGVVGNKSDLYMNEVVKEEDARKLAKDFKYEFELTSAKTPAIFCKFLEKLVYKYIQRKKEMNKETEKKSEKIKKEKIKDKLKHKCCN